MAFNLKRLSAHITPDSQGVANVPLNEGGDLEAGAGNKVVDDVFELLDELDEKHVDIANGNGFGDAEGGFEDLISKITSALSTLPSEVMSQVPDLQGLDAAVKNPASIIEAPENLSDDSQGAKTPAMRLKNKINKCRKGLRGYQSKNCRRHDTPPRGDGMAQFAAKKRSPIEKMEDQKDSKKKKPKPKTSYEKSKKQEENESGKGKKSNPFRYLMGQVEKLYDRNWSKSKIEAYIHKIKDFDRDMIGEAYDLVRKRKAKDEQDQKSSKKASSFNLKVVTASKEENESTYDIEVDFTKRSTRDLMSRLYYLSWCQKFDPDTDSGNINNGRPAEKTSVQSEINKIKDALKKLGYNEDDFKRATACLHEDVYGVETTTEPYECENKQGE